MASSPSQLTPSFGTQSQSALALPVSVTTSSSTGGASARAPLAPANHPTPSPPSAVVFIDGDDDDDDDAFTPGHKRPPARESRPDVPARHDRPPPPSLPSQDAFMSQPPTRKRQPPAPDSEFATPGKKRRTGGAVGDAAATTAASTAITTTPHDDDGVVSCTICFSALENSGRHRIVCLRCGHLFGASCIKTWIRKTRKNCPTCKASAKESDIRMLYDCRVKVHDTAGYQRALSMLSEERKQSADLRMQNSQLALEVRRITKEYNALRTRCANLEATLTSAGASASSALPPARPPSRTGSAAPPSQESPVPMPPLPAFLARSHPRLSSVSPVNTPNTPPPTTAVVFAVPTVLPVDNARAFALAPSHGMVVVAHNPRARQHVVVKADYADPRHATAVTQHSNIIRDVAVAASGADVLVLTASQDNSVRVASATTDTAVATLALPCAAWSCCWLPGHPQCFAAGLANATIAVYDLRRAAPTTPLAVLEPPHGVTRQPIHSLVALGTGASVRLMAASFRNVVLWRDATGGGALDAMTPLVNAGIAMPPDADRCVSVTAAAALQHTGNDVAAMAVNGALAVSWTSRAQSLSHSLFAAPPLVPPAAAGDAAAAAPPPIETLTSGVGTMRRAIARAAAFRIGTQLYVAAGHDNAVALWSGVGTAHTLPTRPSMTIAQHSGAIVDVAYAPLAPGAAASSTSSVVGVLGTLDAAALQLHMARAQ